MRSKRTLRVFICAVLIFTILSSSILNVLAVDETSTVTGMRMQPLVEELANMPQADIDKSIAKYADISNHWGRQDIGKLTKLGILTGVGNNKFSPDGDMSVAAFLKVVVLSLGYKITPSAKGYWATPYIEQAKKDKLIDDKEYTDYNKTITREQAAKIIYRAATLFQPAVENVGYVNVMRNRIKDYAQIGDPYKGYFVKAYIMGYFILDKSALSNPKAKLTRAQACTVAIRLLQTDKLPVFEPVEGEYFLGMNGEKYYPVGSDEAVKAINFVDKNMNKSKGYVDRVAASNAAGYGFYKDEQEKITNPILGTDFSLSIYNRASIYPSNWPYEFNIFDPSETKKLHMDFINELFKYLFGTKSADAIKEFNTIFYSNSTWVNKDIKIGDRYIRIWGEGESYMVAITCKGGLSFDEFRKKYPEW